MTDDDPPFIGDWERKCILGKGSFGQVNLWKNKVKKEQIAIKKCTAILKNIPKEDYEKLKSRWIYELKIMLEAKCDYIVKAIKVEPKEFIERLNQTNSLNFPLLVMEYCEGGDLRRFLCKLENSNGLIESEVRNILKCLRYAIEYLHNNNITHRDLKPENILIQHKNGANFYKLADLGYAKEIEETNGHSVVGTSEYIAPEIIGSTKYSKRVDYWSLGIIIFEIICGIRPFLPNQNMITRMIELKQKTSKEIAILDPYIKLEFKKTQNLLHENQITNYFGLQIEEWLRLALEFNEKQRGSEFVHKITATDEVQSTPIQPPEYTLKFYIKLDEILNTKILTIYSLINYKFLSYPVNKMNDLNDLQMAISNDTQIPIDEIYFILPMEQTKFNRITEKTKPIDFYLEDQNNSPMIYITRYKHTLERESIVPYISEMIGDILASDDNVKLELSCLKEFARQVLFLYRNEQKHYVELLKGLKTYAINLNDSIIKLHPLVFEVNNKTMIACANIKLHVHAISYSKQKLEDNNMLDFCKDIVDEWNSYLNNLEDDYKLQEINARNHKTYESVLRRSKEAIDSQLLEIRDFFNVKKLEYIYDKLRISRELSDKLILENKQNLIKCCYDCMNVRDVLLKSRELEHIQKNITGIHSEFVRILEIVQKLKSQLDKYEHNIVNANQKHQDQLCEIYENFTRRKMEEEFKKYYSNCVIVPQNNSEIINKIPLQQSTNYSVNNNVSIDLPLEPVVLSLPNGGEPCQASIFNTMNSSWLEDIDANAIINENIDNLLKMANLLSLNPISDDLSNTFQK